MGTGDRSHALVTGGAGFIGRRLVRALIEQGAEVTVAGRRPSPEPAVRSVVGDLRDEAVLADALRPGTDVVFHLAAATSVLGSVKDPAGTYRANLATTAALLESSRARGVASFLFASTNAVAGDTAGAVITEQSPLRPLTPYGATKAAAEMLISAYAAAYGIAGASLRFTNVYGPGMRGRDSFLARVLEAAAHDRGVQIYGDGSQCRDLVHVDDVVAGVLLAWRARHRGPLILGSGDAATVNDIVLAARSVTGAPIPVEHLPSKPGEMPAVVVDICAARALGFSPVHDLKSGIATVWPEFAPTAVEGKAAQ